MAGGRRGGWVGGWVGRRGEGEGEGEGERGKISRFFLFPPNLSCFLLFGYVRGILVVFLKAGAKQRTFGVLWVSSPVEGGPAEGGPAKSGPAEEGLADRKQNCPAEPDPAEKTLPGKKKN